MNKETYKPQKLYKNGAERTVTSAAQAAEARAEGWSDTKPVVTPTPVVASPTPTFPETPYGATGEQARMDSERPAQAKPFFARDAEPKPVTGSLPTDFPGREILVAAGLDTVEKVRGVFGDKGVNAETIAKIQTALRATV